MKNYKFKHTENTFIKTNLNFEESYEKDFLRIDTDGTITIIASKDKPYYWDGCSPKLNILDLPIGTPDGILDLKTGKPKAYYASLFHDVIYLYKSDVPISRKESDKIFLILLEQSDYFWKDVYYFFVRSFGRILGKWKTKSKRRVSIYEYSWMNII